MLGDVPSASRTHLAQHCCQNLESALRAPEWTLGLHLAQVDASLKSQIEWEKALAVRVGPMVPALLAYFSNVYRKVMRTCLLA